MTDLADDDLATAAVWWARLAHRDALPGRALAGRRRLGALRARLRRSTSPRSIPAGGRPTGWLVDVRYRACDGRIVRLEASPGLADPGLPLWFAEIAHATSDIPSASLVAFRGDEFPRRHAE